jgi:Na+/H+-dicarboxylate symporter
VINVFKKVSLPIQLILVIALSLFIGQYLNSYVVQFFYTFSTIFKEILGFFLPFIVFSFILAGILSFKKNAPIVVGILLGTIITSNLLVTFFSFNIGKLFLPILKSNATTATLSSNVTINPLVNFSLPSIISSEKAMFAALVIGIILSFVAMPRIEKFAFSFKNIVEKILNYFFIPMLPLYVFGFLLKITHEGVFGALFKTYGKTFGLILLIQMLYLGFMYLAASGFTIKKAILFIKNAVPSYLTAFSTMSSTASIPVTINCAEKNKVGRPLAQISAPIMANVHLIGDGISVPIMATVTMALFLGIVPNFVMYTKFIIYFCMVMLATSGVPGGGIIVVIPLLKSILGFTPEMISIITALYLLQDCFGTAGNVTGDGALMIIINKILKKLKV